MIVTGLLRFFFVWEKLIFLSGFSWFVYSLFRNVDSTKLSFILHVTMQAYRFKPNMYKASFQEQLPNSHSKRHFSIKNID